MSHSTSQIPSPARTNPGRRTFLQWMTYATGALAAAVLAVPFVGYLFGALRKHQAKWVKLGPPSKFPLNETLKETFDNPLGQPWDGMAARTGVYVRKLGEDRFLVFAMNCATWVAR